MESVKNSILELEKRLSSYKDLYNNRKGQKKRIEKNIKENEIKLEYLNNQKDIYLKTKLLLEKSGEFAREQAKTTIEKIVTKALDYIIHDRNMRFVIEMDYVKGRSNGTIAEFYVEEDIDGMWVKYKPKEAKGGGIVDVVSLALLFAMKFCYGLKGPLILDEPTKHLSRDYSVKVTEFLKDISSNYDTQIIMVTHNDYLSESADKVFKARMLDNRTVVEVEATEDIEKIKEVF